MVSSGMNDEIPADSNLILRRSASFTSKQLEFVVMEV
jgi:hypothetical protein